MLVEFLEKAVTMGCDAIEIEYKDHKEWVTAFSDCVGCGIGCLDSGEAKSIFKEMDDLKKKKHIILSGTARDGDIASRSALFDTTALRAPVPPAVPIPPRSGVVSAMLSDDGQPGRTGLRAAFVVLEVGGGLSPSPSLIDGQMPALPPISAAVDRGLAAWLLFPVRTVARKHNKPNSPSDAGCSAHRLPTLARRVPWRTVGQRAPDQSETPSRSRTGGSR
jgi:hypothetical protein